MQPQAGRTPACASMASCDPRPAWSGASPGSQGESQQLCSHEACRQSRRLSHSTLRKAWTRAIVVIALGAHGHLLGYGGMEGSLNLCPHGATQGPSGMGCAGRPRQLRGGIIAHVLGLCSMMQMSLRLCKSLHQCTTLHFLHACSCLQGLRFEGLTYMRLSEWCGMYLYQTVTDMSTQAARRGLSEVSFCAVAVQCIIRLTVWSGLIPHIAQCAQES